MRLSLSILLCFVLGGTAIGLDQAKPVPPSTAGAPATQTKKRAASPAITTTLSITITDGTGAPLDGVMVTATGPLTREGNTDFNGSLRFQRLASGRYRLRFARDGFTTLERDVEIPARQATMAQHVMLSSAPRPASAAPPPLPLPSSQPPPEAPRSPSVIPPPGKPLTLSVPDFIERNFIKGGVPQKISPVACSGLASTLLWQIREPWENRQHAGADAMLYVVGGAGTLRLDGRDVRLQAGSFASVPRGTTYSLTRRGRNPLIMLATLTGEPCQQ